MFNDPFSPVFLMRNPWTTKATSSDQERAPEGLSYEEQKSAQHKSYRLEDAPIMIRAWNIRSHSHDMSLRLQAFSKFPRASTVSSTTSSAFWPVDP